MELPDAARADFAVAAWCAKEVLYKLAGRRGLDLLRDLEITASRLEHGSIAGRIEQGPEIGMRVMQIEEYIVVYSDKI
jgi:phosphopantetheinyl transferase